MVPIKYNRLHYRENLRQQIYIYDEKNIYSIEQIKMVWTFDADDRKEDT